MKRTALAVAIGMVCASFSGVALAQNDDQTDPSTARDMSQQRQNEVAEQQRRDGQTQDGSETMDVTVDQAPADVQVQQESPNIKVEQSKPDVTIEQPKPEVTIEQPEPDVTVEEAEPNVTVEQQGEPDVSIEQADNAEVEVNRAEDERDGSQQSAQQNQNQSQHVVREDVQQDEQGHSLMSERARDLEGMTVVNQQGDEVGDIQHIARHQESGELFAIVAIGGFWGFGASDVALPVKEMQREEDQLVVNTDYGSEEIEASADEYRESDYQIIDNQTALSDAEENA